MPIITIDRPVDAHFHARHPADPRFQLIRYAFMYFDAAVFMPNLHPVPIVNDVDVSWYREQIMRSARALHYPDFIPLIAAKATHDTSRAGLRQLKRANMCGMKFYPVDANGAGMTTNEAGGVGDFFAPMIQNIFRFCEAEGVPALLHGEFPDRSIPEEEREWAFSDILKRIVDLFPELQLVFEHISDARMVELIKSMPSNVHATITTHHLVNVIDDNENPHNKCLPTAKFPGDRAALVAAATSGNPKFFFGSDCAPHLRITKEQPEEGKGPANGVFNSPVFPAVIRVFEEQEALHQLNDFVSTRARAFYGLGPATRQVKYVKDVWHVAPEYGGVVPLFADMQVHWRIDS